MNIELTAEDRTEFEKLIRQVIREEIDQLKTDSWEWVDLDGAVELLKFSRAKIYQLTSTNQIPFHKIGNDLRFNRTELSEWLKKNGRNGK